MSENQPSEAALKAAEHIITIENHRLMLGGTHLYVGVTLPPMTDPEQSAAHYREPIAHMFDRFAAQAVAAREAEIKQTLEAKLKQIQSNPDEVKGLYSGLIRSWENALNYSIFVVCEARGKGGL